VNRERPDTPRPTASVTALPGAGAPTEAPDYRTLAYVAQRARECTDRVGLAFVAANETWHLAHYRQAFVFLGEPLALATVSGLASVAEQTPFLVWLRALAADIHGRLGNEPLMLSVDDAPGALRADWSEWLPAVVLVYPLDGPDGRRTGTLWLCLDASPDDEAFDLLSQAAEIYGHGFWALGQGDRRWAPRAVMGVRRNAWWIALGLVLLSLIPVRLSVLAPAEVIALEAAAVASPLDGVVASFAVKPNQPVKAGDRLFSLDGTTLASRREVAMKQLAVARADAMAATQKAFGSDDSRADLAVLNGRVAERQAEVAALDELLQRVEVKAGRDGIAVFGDVDDWQGRPVVTGERILQLADPADAGLLVWLPVADAINLAEGAEVRLYLQTAPLTPLPARIVQTSYQATLSPEGVASYRIRARFDDPAAALPVARIGLKGTAKIHGERAPLAYYLLRRPLAAARAWTGW
jgi:hypothetical protein